MAISQSNSGGAWDNAKKYVEAGLLLDNDGNVIEEGSEEHKAVVVGDTVGDPLKDTSGPALNILMKLMAIISLVFADFFIAIGLQVIIPFMRWNANGFLEDNVYYITEKLIA